MNPLRWPPKHRAGLIAVMMVGAALMLALQHKLAGAGSITYWLTNRPDDALIWATLGAVVAGGIVYAWRSFSKNEN